MDVSEAKRLRQLEDENAKLKKLLAEQMLDAAALRELLSKMYDPPRPCKGPFRTKDDAVCTNVSGLLQVGCCCSQAMMRSARAVPR
jgi:putative transposase